MKFVGIDFPSLFDKDNFTSRRTTGHNMLDPESLISGAEIAKGMTFTNSTRRWYTEEWYLAAVRGDINTDTILEYAPRVFKTARLSPEHGPWVQVPNRLEELQALAEE